MFGRQISATSSKIFYQYYSRVYSLSATTIKRMSSSSTTTTTTTTTTTSTSTTMTPLSPELEELHRTACAAGQDTYIDPATGYTVFTSLFHEKKGKCCGNACRHCPYGHVNVKNKKKLEQLRGGGGGGGGSNTNK